MARRGLFVGALCAMLGVILLAGQGATAAPVAGGQRVNMNLGDHGEAPVFMLDSPFGSLDPSFLPDANCAFSPAAGSSQLDAEVRGWIGPTLPVDSDTREVILHANLHGTVMDTAGNTYQVNGSFDENGIPQFPLDEAAFQGSGHLSISGPAGTVVGEAMFVDVTLAPPEWDFYFTSIQNCDLRG